MRKSIIIGIILILIIGVLFLFFQLKLTGKAINEEKEPIKIGFIGPLSGYGAAWGLEQQNALDIGVKEINNAGGIDGRKIEIIYEDGKCDGKEALTAAQKLIDVDKVEILIPVCSAETLAVIPIAERNQILVISVWPTNPKISGSGEYIFRLSYSDEDIGKRMVEVISKDYNKVGVITELNDYPVGLRDSFKKYFNGEIIEETYQSNSKDVRTQVIKLINKKPEAILINPNSPATGLEVLNQLKELGYKGTLFGNFFGESNEVIKDKNSEGLIFFTDPIVSDNSIKEHLLNEYIKEVGKKPDFEFAVSAQYDAIYIIKQAIENVGYDPAKLKDYLHSTNNFNGALGNYYFDKNGDAIGLKISVKQIKNGKVVLYNQ